MMTNGTLPIAFDDVGDGVGLERDDVLLVAHEHDTPAWLRHPHHLA